MSRSDALASAFTACRPLLTRVAYAVLGSISEAEDVVSDTWANLVMADAREPVRDVPAWATVAVSRRALDVLGSARIQRASYVGPWLPEPALMGPASQSTGITDTDPADRVTLDETVSYALLVVLEALTPAERTAWVLHDLFGMEFAAVADVVGRSESAVRQLASRARRHVADGKPRVSVSAGEHRAMTRAFARACGDGDIDALVGLLDPDVTLISDGGGQVTAARLPVRGAAKVALFMTRVTANVSGDARAEITDVNRSAGIVVREQGRVTTVIVLAIDGPRITGVQIVRAPDKLAGLG